jgi:hypothetical protein
MDNYYCPPEDLQQLAYCRELEQRRYLEEQAEVKKKS